MPLSAYANGERVCVCMCVRVCHAFVRCCTSRDIGGVMYSATRTPHACLLCEDGSKQVHCYRKLACVSLGRHVQWYGIKIFLHPKPARTPFRSLKFKHFLG